ncbi:GGDEF domain-containing protein [Aquabacterium sp.]|uniref:GGDEF domain-containing protein n=1 Tax=Aquabacterium sp. TaxID=1872578 RepID=UPI0025B9917A|nr:GGDEF domain-containing protein [Aquabacterium sp.]
MQTGHPFNDQIKPIRAIGQGAYRTLLTIGGVLAALVHLAFALLFWQDGVPSLARFNVASVLVYLLALRLIQRRHVGVALSIMGAEIMAHAIAAVVVVGWDSGFHYYLLVVIPVILTNQRARWPVKIAAVLCFSTVYLGLDWFCHRALPLQPIAPQLLRQLHLFNLAATLFVLSALTIAYVRLINAAERRLHELATTDSLTGLMNRRSLLEALDRDQAIRQRQPHPISLILVDIDHFKPLNDTHGHAMGDWALQGVAQALQQGVRDMDLVARWGGEEFLIVLPFADTAAALPVAERLREAIAALRLSQTAEGEGLHLTATLGLAELRPDEPHDQGIRRADEALYRGKREGRNRVVLG